MDETKVAIKCLLEANSWPDVHSCVVEHPILFGPTTIDAIKMIAASPKLDDFTAAMLEDYAQFLGSTSSIEKLAERRDLHWHEANNLFGSSVSSALEAFERYRHQGDIGQLDMAISLWNAVIQNPQFSSTPLGYRQYAFDSVSAAQISRFIELNQPEDLSVGIETLERTITETIETSRFLPRRLTNLTGALAQRARFEDNQKDLEKAVEVSTKAVALTSPEDPLLPGRINNLIGSLASLNQFTNNPKLLKQALEHYDKIINRPDIDDTTRARLHHGQGMVLRQQYAIDDFLATLDASLAAFRAAVQCSSITDRARALYLGDLGITLGTRFEEVGHRKDLDDAVQHLKEAVKNASVPNEVFMKNHQALATTYQIRFDNFSDRKDLVKATKSLAVVLGLEEPSNERAWQNALQNYGRCLEYRLAIIKNVLKAERATGEILEELSDIQWQLFKISGNNTLRSESLNNARKAINLRRGRHRRDVQMVLAERLANSNERDHAKGNIDEAIELVRAAARKAPKDEARIYESNIAWMLVKRYNLLREVKDLQTGLELMEGWLSSADRIEEIHNYLAAVEYQFEQGNFERLDKAIEEGLRGLKRYRQFSSPRCQVVSGTAENLRRRYELSGKIKDVDLAWDISIEGTDQGRQQNSLCAPIFNALGWAARTRFDVSNELEYLEQAITAYEKAAELSGNNPIFLTNVGSSLRARNSISGEETDLDRSIAVLREAVEGSKGGFGEELAWMSLANSLSQRFRRSKSVSDIDEAIQAYSYTAKGKSLRARQGATIGWARSLLEKFDIQPNQKLLKEAIKLLEQWQLEELPPQVQPTFAITLADAYALMPKQDSARVSSLYRHAIDSGRVFDLDVALAATSSWMESCFIQQDWQEASEVGEIALMLINEILDITLNLGNKNRWLKMIGDLPAQCAYAFAKQGSMEQAVSAIEGSRARIMSESLDLGRRDLERLPELGYGRLYDEFKSLAAQLRETEFETSNSLYRQELAVANRAGVENRFQQVLQEIRQISGYEDVLDRDSIHTLTTACTARPLVYLLTTKAGGLAIVVYLLNKKLRFGSVWLPELRQEDFHKHLGFEELTDAQTYLGAFLGYRRDPHGYWERWKDTLNQTCIWMGHVAIEKLSSELPKQVSKSGITLIPCGYLSLLPWHAARLMSGDYVSSVFPIAYSPNARALARYREPPPNSKLLIVADPQPVSSIRLPFVDYEVSQTLKAWTEENCTVVKTTEATVVKVTDILAAYGVFHFVGHAHANIIEPVRSGLQMAQDQVLTVDMLADQKIDLQLAILSACETAVPGLESVNELVSLPTALVQVGCRSVIGSMWLVLDQASALLIGEFHRYWRKDSCSPLQALHKAQQTLRESGMEHPAYWAAFMYTGPD